MTSDVKVFSNLYDEVMTFESKEEFNRYYAKNKESIDKMATRGLNVKFKINGYKIGRSKGELILYPVKDSHENIEIPQETTDETGLTVHQKLNNLNKKLKNIENILNQLLEAIFENQNDTRQPIPTHSQQSSRFATYGM